MSVHAWCVKCQRTIEENTGKCPECGKYLWDLDCVLGADWYVSSSVNVVCPMCGEVHEVTPTTGREEEIELKCKKHPPLKVWLRNGEWREPKIKFGANAGKTESLAKKLVDVLPWRKKVWYGK